MRGGPAAGLRGLRGEAGLRGQAGLPRSAPGLPPSARGVRRLPGLPLRCVRGLTGFGARPVWGAEGQGSCFTKQLGGLHLRESLGAGGEQSQP